MRYDINITRSAQKSLAKIPNKYQEKIIKAIKDLSLNPHPPNSKKLTGRDAWRIRINDYRVIYEIKNEILIITIIIIRHRKNVYIK